MTTLFATATPPSSVVAMGTAYRRTWIVWYRIGEQYRWAVATDTFDR